MIDIPPANVERVVATMFTRLDIHFERLSEGQGFGAITDIENAEQVLAYWKDAISEVYENGRLMLDLPEVLEIVEWLMAVEAVPDTGTEDYPPLLKLLCVRRHILDAEIGAAIFDQIHPHEIIAAIDSLTVEADERRHLESILQAITARKGAAHAHA